MKKLFFISVFVFGFLFSKAQFNPVTNLIYNSAYNFPGYSSCPQYSCFYLTWHKPDTLSVDTLIGYTIYQNDIFYAFVTDTTYGCPYINICAPSASNWFVNTPFWITVKAVYNKDSVASIANADSIYVGGFPIGVSKLKEKNTFSVSPNPFSTETVLKANSVLTNASLVFYNRLGEEVRQIKNISGTSISITRDDLPRGFYFIRIRENNKTIGVEKIIISDN